MAVFSYKGFDAQGKSVKGLKDADSEKALRGLLRKDGIRATEITATKASSTGGNAITKDIQLFQNLQRRVKVNDLALATRQLATLLTAGVDMVGSLTALIEQVEHPGLKEILAEIKADVNEGQALATAMEKHKAFDRIYVNMVRAGESSGTLDVVLERLADLKEGQSRLQGQIMGMLTYPIIMMVIGVLLVSLMFVVVVPKITAVFEHTKSELPWMTKALIGMSSFMRDYWWLLILIIGGVIFAFVKWKNSENGQKKWDRFVLKVPILGKVSKLLGVARFARTLGTLLSSGVPLLTSLEIVKNVVANDVLMNAVESIRDAVREGEDIAPPLKRTNVFPPMVNHMVAIGEKSGELEQMLERIAKTYEEQVEVQTKAMMSILSPLILVFMAGSVGFVMFAIMKPIMAMSQMVH